MSQDCRAIVWRQQYDVRTSFANMSPQKFGEFTMRKFRDTGKIVVQLSYDSRATVLRIHVNISRLLKKLKLGDMNVARHAHECLATVVRMKMKLKRNFVKQSHECLATVTRQSRDYVATLARYISKIRPK